jgi:uncharacterized protein YaaN involved in tellurite resistance
MFDSNVNLIKELEKYIIAGQLKYQQVSEELAVMEGNPANYQDYEISDKRNFACLDKRLADMKVVRFYTTRVFGTNTCGTKQQYLL